MSYKNMNVSAEAVAEALDVMISARANEAKYWARQPNGRAKLRKAQEQYRLLNNVRLLAKMASQP